MLDAGTTHIKHEGKAVLINVTSNKILSQKGNKMKLYKMKQNETYISYDIDLHDTDSTLLSLSAYDVESM